LFPDESGARKSGNARSHAEGIAFRAPVADCFYGLGEGPPVRCCQAIQPDPLVVSDPPSSDHDRAADTLKPDPSSWHTETLVHEIDRPRTTLSCLEGQSPRQATDLRL